MMLLLGFGLGWQLAGTALKKGRLYLRHLYWFTLAVQDEDICAVKRVKFHKLDHPFHARLRVTRRQARRFGNVGQVKKRSARGQKSYKGWCCLNTSWCRWPWCKFGVTRHAEIAGGSSRVYSIDLRICQRSIIAFLDVSYGHKWNNGCLVARFFFCLTPVWLTLAQKCQQVSRLVWTIKRFQKSQSFEAKTALPARQ